MGADEKKALIEHAKSWIANADAARDELPFGFDEDTEKEISLIKIALAALTAPPDDWQQRAETAEAKLAEVDKQEPIYQLMDDDTWYDADPHIYHEITAQGYSGRIVYRRPAPAVHLAELVPPEMTKEMAAQLFFGKAITAVDVWNTCRAAILRNIVEAG